MPAQAPKVRTVILKTMLSSQRLILLAWGREWGVPLFVSFSTYGLLWLAHAPRQSPESAYIFLLPVLAWFHFKPGYRKTIICLFISGWVYQVAMVGWMRHVSPGGMWFATFLLSCYNLPWFLAARFMYERFSTGGFISRFLVILGLSCFWVFIEWARTLFTLGFPWCPLSVTQWERPVILQVAYFSGGWSVSFFLVFFNLCVGSYIHHILIRRRTAKGFIERSICPDLYLGLLLLFFMVFPFFQNRSFNNNRDMDTLKVGICQPYLLDKWKEGRASMHKEILRRQTKFLSLLKPDLIIWPEASSPYPLNLDRLWAEELSKETQTPILAGSVIREKDTSYNAMVYLDPQSGMDSRWYAKQVLVPFGEYVPNPFAYIPGFRKLVGPVGNFLAGEHPHIFEFPLGGGDSRVNLRIGNLICYEDIFPYISRTTSEEDIDLLVVSTNDAWFKEEGCAEQHAAHSVLRAVENGIPIVRCGNAGWSGWIDRMGIQREVLRNKEGSVYFQGAKVLEVKVPRRSDNDEFRVGDHFAHICGFLSLAIGLYVYFTHKKAAFNP